MEEDLFQPRALMSVLTIQIPYVRIGRQLQKYAFNMLRCLYKESKRRPAMVRSRSCRSVQRKNRNDSSTRSAHFRQNIKNPCAILDVLHKLVRKNTFTIYNAFQNYKKLTTLSQKLMLRHQFRQFKNATRVNIANYQALSNVLNKLSRKQTKNSFKSIRTIAKFSKLYYKRKTKLALCKFKALLTKKYRILFVLLCNLAKGKYCSVIQRMKKSYKIGKINQRRMIRSGFSAFKELKKSFKIVEIHQTRMVKSGFSAFKELEKSFKIVEIHQTRMVKSGFFAFKELKKSYKIEKIHQRQMVKSGFSAFKELKKSFKIEEIYRRRIISSKSSAFRQLEKSKKLAQIYQTRMVKSGFSAFKELKKTYKIEEIYRRQIKQSEFFAFKQIENSHKIAKIHQKRMIKSGFSAFKELTKTYKIEEIHQRQMIKSGFSALKELKKTHKIAKIHQRQMIKSGFSAFKQLKRIIVRKALSNIDVNERRIHQNKPPKPPLLKCSAKIEGNSPLIVGSALKVSRSVEINPTISKYIRVNLTFKKCYISRIWDSFQRWSSFECYHSPRFSKTVLPRPSSIHDYIDDVAVNFRKNTLISYSRNQSSTTASYTFMDIYSKI